MNQKLIDEVTATIGAEQSAEVALSGLHDALVAARAQNDPAAFDGIIASLATERDKVTAAIAANPSV